MFISKLEKETLLLKNDKLLFLARILFVIAGVSFTLLLLSTWLLNSALVLSLFGGILVTSGGFSGYFLDKRTTVSIFTKSEIKDYMMYFCKLNYDVRDYVIDEEKQTVILKRNKSIMGCSDTDVIEEVSMDYIIKESHVLKEREEAISKQTQIYKGDFDRLKEDEKKVNSQPISANEEFFNTVKARMQEKEGKKKSKKVYM